MKKYIEGLEPERHIYLFGKKGLTQKIIEKTTQKGILKLKYAMREVGYDEDKILAVYGPGGAVTNTPRERIAGFEDGIKLFVGDCLWPYLGPVCGYAMYYIGDRIDLPNVKKRYRELKKEGVRTDSIVSEIGTDYGNHFLAIRKLDEKINGLEQGFYAFIHNSLRIAGKAVFDYMRSSLDVNRVETPWGMVNILDRRDAEKFVKKCDEMAELAKRKRTAIAEKIFENPIQIMNADHKGYFKKGNFFGVRAGVFDSLKETTAFVGFTKDSPIYLVKGKKNVKKDLWPEEYLRKTEELGVGNLLENANIMPHGGAETADDWPYDKVEYDLEKDILIIKNHMTVKIREPSKLNIRFKKPEEVIPWIEKYELGKVICKFDPMVNLH